MTGTQDDLTLLHEAMTLGIKAKMPMLKDVRAYDPTARDTVITPAVLIEAVEMKPGGRVSGGRLPVTVEFVAHCCLSIKTPQVELEIRNFAIAVLRLINGNKWGLSEAVERPEQLHAFPGMFKPDDKGFESWAVSWEQTIHVGEVWQDADFLPTEVYVGEAPNVGADNKQHYEGKTDE